MHTRIMHTRAMLTRVMRAMVVKTRGFERNTEALDGCW